MGQKLTMQGRAQAGPQWSSDTNGTEPRMDMVPLPEQILTGLKACPASSQRVNLARRFGVLFGAMIPLLPLRAVSMSDIGFTREERQYIQRVHLDTYTSKWRLGYYAAMIGPMSVFGIYGLFRRDYVAEFIAFAGLLAFLCWRIAQELERMDVFKSVFLKLAEHERNDKLDD
jgi:hypothetical protein